MSKKRKNQKRAPEPVSVEAWREWLADPEGTAPLAEPERALEALRFLGREADAPPEVEGNLALALVGLLERSERHDLLLRCAESGAPQLSKLARKTLHQLRRQGADIPEPQPRPAGSAGASPAGGLDDDRRAALSAPTHDGQVLIFVRLRGALDRRLYAAVATVNDTRGLVRMTGYVAKSGLYGIMVRSAREKTAVAELPFEYAVARLHEAAARAREQGRILPDSWVMLKPHLPPPSDVPAHPAEALPAGELPDAARQWALFDEEVLTPLLPSMTTLEALQSRIGEVLGSQVIVDDTQRAEQIARWVGELLATELAPPNRAAWARRLEDAAWIAAQDRKRDVSESVLAIRDALRSSEDPTAIPFFRQVLVRAFVGRVPPSLLRLAAPGLPLSPEAQPQGTPERSPLWTPEQDPGGVAEEAGDDLIVPG